MAKTPESVTMHVKVVPMSCGDVAREARELVEREMGSVLRWAQADDTERQDAQAVVHASLLRLLDDPAWLPGSVRLSPGRLDVHLAIELHSETEHQARVSRAQLRVLRTEARGRLLALADQLQDDVEDSDG